MSVNIDQLVGFQRAEFARAGRLRLWTIGAQFAIGAPAIVSVFVDDYGTLFYLGLWGLVAFLIWFAASELQARSRIVAEQARRATLVMGGLGKKISPAVLHEIQASLTVSREAAAAQEDVNYFAANGEPGFSRLTEMLEETAFFTEDLQWVSSWVMHGTFAISLLIAIGVFSVVLGVNDPLVRIQTARVVLAALMVFMSSDILGAARAHKSTADQLKALRARLAEIRARTFPEADVLLALSDYNAIVQSAPLIVPFAYQMRRHRLNQLWAKYKEDRTAR
jgi:hypothetical protein